MSAQAIALGFLALLAGCGLSLQAAVNSQLARAIGSPLTATAISFGVGLSVLLVATLATRQPLPTLATARALPPYAWVAGGLLGAFFLFSALALVPRLGVAVVMSMAIAGQLMMAVAFDHYGWMGVALREATLGRIAGVAVMIAGVIMIRLL